MTYNKESFEKLYNDYVCNLKSIAGDDKNFESTRNWNNFQHTVLKLPWGERRCLLQVEENKKASYNLQLSRGMSLSPDMTSEAAYNRIEYLLNNIIESDNVRIDELDAILEQKKTAQIKNYTPKSFFEIGFRVPRLQNFYKQRGLEEGGCDINEFNVASGNMLGFNCFKIDLTEDFKIDVLKKFNLIVCYHVIEHLTNPVDFLKRLYESTSSGTLFHFEIPVEPDGPHVERAHLFSFHEGDLFKMVAMTGFRPLTFSNNTHQGGPWIERVSFFKD